MDLFIYVAFNFGASMNNGSLTLGSQWNSTSEWEHMFEEATHHMSHESEAKKKN